MSVEILSLDRLEDLAQLYGYWVIFIGIALENTGIPLPGETITLVGGFLAGSGDLSYWGVLASAISGAVLGDNCGYWLGKWGGWPLLVRVGGWFRISEAQLRVARQQFSLNAGRAVFFGRFVALLRIFAGPMAGIAQMPYRQFLLCNLGGATVWAVLMVTLAFFVGRLIPLAQLVGWVAQFGVLALVGVVGAIALTIWLESRKKPEISGSDS
ncbi:DedA family protein [Spirulina sp. CCNP1310]|uniref:DedA family protein n=1 Tax=Spirulina sp. CCNP1310 TaxID=3110249 RepID=UPI002B1EC670|nr:DedA family protein [Spirulina sp. CCNP1310]MEA5421127.1 DedA family protein [Spirulina sp. CCNP1310]